MLVPVPRPALLDTKGVVYTKRWVVELLLDLAGYTSAGNLVDAVAVEPSAGERAFLSLMILRLADSCERLGRPISDCRQSLVACELDEKAAKDAGIETTVPFLAGSTDASQEQTD